MLEPNKPEFANGFLLDDFKKFVIFYAQLVHGSMDNNTNGQHDVIAFRKQLCE